MPVGRVTVSSPLGTNTPGTAAAMALRLAARAGVRPDAPKVGFSDAERRAQDEGIAELFGMKKGSKRTKTASKGRK